MTKDQRWYGYKSFLCGTEPYARDVTVEWTDSNTARVRVDEWGCDGHAHERRDLKKEFRGTKDGKRAQDRGIEYAKGVWNNGQPVCPEK